MFKVQPEKKWQNVNTNHSQFSFPQTFHFETQKKKNFDAGLYYSNVCDSHFDAHIHCWIFVLLEIRLIKIKWLKSLLKKR